MRAQDGVGRAGSGRTAFIRQPLEYEDGPNLLSYTKKNTSNQGDDKKAAEKDSVQVSEGFTFDLAERHRTFFRVCERQEVGLGGIVPGQEERSLQWQRFSLFECMCVCAYAALFLFI